MRRVRVESRGGLVEEEHRGVRRHLHPEGEALALLRGQVEDRLAQDRRELDHIRHRFHDLLLLVERHRLWEAVQRREPKGLAHSHALHVVVRLLNIPRHSRKRLEILVVSVDEDATGDLPACLAPGDHVHQRGLARARGPHQRNEHARLKNSVHVREQLPLLVFAHRDGVLEARQGNRHGGRVHREVLKQLESRGGARLCDGLSRAMVDGRRNLLRCVHRVEGGHARATLRHG
mmetsp:Transcript_37213/g.84712  ORF Transcript_37213/g.84712 Transcript_37213/m.84712 type:complete len:233 (-) Transcript_37213:849-1547(-)